MSKKIKIVFILPSFHTGGSERVMIHLLNNLDREKFDITLIALNREGALLEFLPTDIEIIFFNYSRTLSSIFSLYREIKKRPSSIIFSTLNQLNLLVSTLVGMLPGRVFIARESSIVSQQIINSRYPRLFRFLYNTTFQKIHSVICQSQAMKNDLMQTIRIKEGKIKVINNPVDFKLIPPLKIAGPRQTKINIISVGQLRKEKGYNRLLNILSKCIVPFNYKIIGDGPLRGEIANAIRDKGLSGKVELLGSVPLPYPHIANADLFLQGSFYEGFPNAVIEANACGVPVFAIASPGGHNEIIQNGRNGYVATEEELVGLINSRNFLDMDKAAIVAMTKERYALPKIIGQYEAHFMAQFRAVVGKASS
jgi:glycosyltransferase involved in cell wall biosynthesis